MLWLLFVMISVGSSPAPVSEGASTIHLPVKDCRIPEGTNCTMYGWGETKSTAFFQPHAAFHVIFLMTKKPLFLLQVAYCVFCILLCADTGHDEALNSVIMPMVDNDMCSQIKEDAGESRICAGGKRGEGVCDVRISNRQMHPEAKQHGCELNAQCLKVHFTTIV